MDFVEGQSIFVVLDGEGRLVERCSVQQRPPITEWAWHDPAFVAHRLTRLREKRCDDVDVLHAAKEKRGFLYQGKRYELDAGSQGKITSLGADAAACINQVVGSEWVPIAFIAADNSPTVFAQPQDFMPFATAAKKAALALFARRHQLKVLIRASKDPGAIDITAGWPE